MNEPSDEITFVRSEGGWTGVYKNGKLVKEDHRIDAKRLLDTLGYQTSTEFVKEGWLRSRGTLPEDLDDVEVRSE